MGLTQFLLEAGTICLAGGAIGLLLGALVFFSSASVAHLPAAIGLNVVLVALGVSLCVGLFFGYYPARTAAGLLPAAALRVE